MNTKTVTISGWIVYSPFRAKHAHTFPEGPYSFSMFEPEAGEHNVAVCPHTLTAEVPEDFDPRPAQVKALQEQKAKLQAEFSARVVELERQINSLLAIDCEVSA